MENNNNILELRQKIQRRIRTHLIFCIAFSIFYLCFLWALITNFHSQTVTHNIIYGLMFLLASHTLWTLCKLLGPAKKELLSDDATVLEECYKRMNRICKREIFSVVGTVILIIFIGVIGYLYVITHYEIRG